MKIKYRKTLKIIIGVQIIFLCCYLLSHSDNSLSAQIVLNKKILNIVPQQAQSPAIEKMINQTGSTTKLFTDILHVTNGDCIGIRYPIELLAEESWSLIDEEKNSFVFSAYRVDISGKIKVVGASIPKVRNTFCQYWHVIQDNGTVIMHETPANMHFLPESHGTKYSGAIFICPALSTSHHYISLVSGHCKIPLHLLQVKNGIAPENYQRQYTVCLKPLHFRYGRAYELIEWIELNRILGADKIVVYNYSIAINTQQVLNHYVEKDIVEVVQWNMPIKSYTWPKTSDPVEIHSIGMLPMLQDCLLRNRPYSEFVVNADVDEFIIPHSDNALTWSDLFKQIPSRYDTYMFRNTFFRKEWNNYKIEFKNKTIAQKLNITSLQYFEREERIFPARTRSKYFTRTIKGDKSLMIHEVSGGHTYTVPVDKGLLHHYRNWHYYTDTARRVVDKTVLNKYSENLIKRIQNIWENLSTVELDIPV